MLLSSPPRIAVVCVVFVPALLVVGVLRSGARVASAARPLQPLRSQLISPFHEIVPNRPK